MREPARLDKKEDFGWLEIFAMRYGHIAIFFLLVLLLVMIGVLIVMFIDMGTAGNMTMTEANQYYYHLKDVV